MKGIIFKIKNLTFYEPLKLNTQSLRTLFLMILAILSGTPRPLIFRVSENPRYKYQVAPDMAMTVRMIMILLYGADGKPVGGETPMIQISNLFS